MARNTLVINCDIRETRVALIENGIIAELQIERASATGTVGNIVLGRVSRVLPGMQAAFIDVGLDRAAFLHVEDLIRPDDFEAYLAGARKHESAERFNKGAGGRRHGPHAHADGDAEGDDDDDDDDDDDEPVAAAGGRGEAVAAEGAESDDDADDDDDDDADEGDSDDDDDADDDDDDADEGDEDDEDDEDDEEESAPQTGGNPSGGAGAPDDEEPADSEDLGGDGLVEEEEEEEEPDREPPPREEGASAQSNGSGGSSRRRRRRGRGRDKERSGSAGGGAGGGGGGERNASGEARTSGEQANRQRGDRGGRDRNRGGRDRERGDRGRRSGSGGGGGRSTSRVARSVPITEVVKEGDEVIVQISKEPIGTKGARVTSHVSLPGRYVVYLPTVDHVGTSKRIGSARERARLREVVEAMRPPSGGLIVRTVAEGLTKKSLKADIGYLVSLWEEVSRKREGAKAPAVLYTELDLVLKTARDLFTDEIETIVIDDKEQYARLVRFVEMFMPARVKDVQLYTGDEPIFDAYGIEDEISRALSRKVQLPSGGYLIIDQAEALTAIDVNTGRYVGKGSRDLEETALKTNLEAVDEIAYQLRFRNIGGLVILDLIDMDVAQNREKVWRALEQRLAKDKAKTTINRISELGLIEMTRKRTRESLGRTMHETCFYCDGTGQVQSKTTIVYEILRQIRRERHGLPGYSVLVNAHPAVVDVMQGEERAAVQEAEKRYMRRIEFNPRTEYHIEQFDLHGK
ncbi:MAG TPA: Rne/Rng family ribonuclease [Polyangiaceae bacterium]|nr:Rne/Rng family ribonuclease [Polyangiaceae bacterium]